jgi:hypothetical protein
MLSILLLLLSQGRTPWSVLTIPCRRCLQPIHCRPGHRCPTVSWPGAIILYTKAIAKESLQRPDWPNVCCNDSPPGLCPGNSAEEATLCGRQVLVMLAALLTPNHCPGCWISTPGKSMVSGWTFATGWHSQNCRVSERRQHERALRDQRSPGDGGIKRSSL